MVEEILEQQSQTLSEADKLDQMEQAAHDPLFMADLRETMSAFAEVDTEWWERSQWGTNGTFSRLKGPANALIQQ